MLPIYFFISYTRIVAGRAKKESCFFRWISQKNHPDNDVPDSRFTHMVMQFGQFLDHDITLTPKDGE